MSTTRDESLPCCTGVIPNDYVSLGEEITLPNNLPTYIVKPSSSDSSTKAIIVSYDIFGFTAGGTRRFIDNLSKDLGVTVIMADYFRGDAWPASDFPFKDPALFMKWVTPFLPTSAEFTVVTQDVEAVKTHLKSLGVTKTGVLGFCYGGKIAITIAKDAEACAICHGSFLADEDATDVKCPTLLLDAKSDPDRSNMLKTLESNGVTDASSIYKRYDNMEHGWTIRGDSTDAAQKAAMEDAYTRVLDFFKQNLV